MLTTLRDCPVCTGPPVPRVVWLVDLTPVDQRRYAAWDAQPCAACGLALDLHQTWRHPHRLLTAETHCGGFRPAHPVEEEER